MNKTKERSLLEGAKGLLKGIQSCDLANSYGAGIFADQLLVWEKALDSDHPIESTRSLLDAAKHEASQIVSAAQLGAQEIIRRAESDANAIRQRADKIRTSVNQALISAIESLRG